VSDDVLSRYDLELQRLDGVFCAAWDIEPHHHVLDVGCGEGRTTRRAARAAHDGQAHGVDVSRDAIERASAAARNVPNVSFEVADVQTHDLGRDRFDVVISRFGTMFFADPSAAFANINNALHPGGRIVMLVWQPAAENEWDAAIHEALSGRTSNGHGLEHFSLGDPAHTENLLSGSGFERVAFQDVREPIRYGSDVGDALDFVRRFAFTRALLAGQDERPALERLRAMLETHQRDDGVWFDSAAWLVTAVRSA